MRLARRIVDDFFGKSTLIYPGDSSGRMNTIFYICPENRVIKYVLRIRRFNLEGFSQAIGNEYIIARRYPELNSIIPRTVINDMGGETYGAKYSITEYIPGTTLEKGGILDYYSAGQALAKVHNNSMPFCGKLNFASITTDYAKAYNQYFVKTIGTLSQYYCKLAEEINRFIEFSFNPNAYDGIMPVLVHNDFHSRNVIIDSSHNIKLIDWDCSKYAHSELDFIKFMTFLSDNRMTACMTMLLNGYQSVRRLEITENFKVHTLIWYSKMVAFETANPYNSSDRYFPSRDYYINQISRILKEKE